MLEKISREHLPVPVGLERRIYLIRGLKVMIDSDLAELYQVPTFRLNEAVKRNRRRFPADFMFQLTRKEADCLISQIAMSKNNRGGRRTLPYAFTEHGVAMLSSVLKSERAIQMNIVIVRAFLRLRDVLATHKELARKVAQLQSAHKDHAVRIALVAKDLQTLAKHVVAEIEKLNAPTKQKSRIGFVATERKASHTPTDRARQYAVIRQTNPLKASR